MVDRRLRNCPLCGEQNAMFMYRTDVGSGQTIATCSYCDDEIIVNPSDSPPLSPFSSPGFTNSSPMSQARILSSQEGKIETGSQESKNDTAFELTQPVTNSQSSLPSEPSSPEGLSSGEQVRRRGPRGAMEGRIEAIRLARERNSRVPVRRGNSYRTLGEQRAARGRAVRALNTFMGRVPLTPRERAQRLADADADAAAAAQRAVAAAMDAALVSSSDSDDDDYETDAEPVIQDMSEQFARLNNPTYIKQREIDILKNRLNLHKTNEMAPEDSPQKILYNFKKAINNAINSDKRKPQPSPELLIKQRADKKKRLSRRRSIHQKETRQVFDAIMYMHEDILEYLNDNTNVVFQLDKPPYSAFGVSKSVLADFLKRHDRISHTKYMCMGTGSDVLEVTEDNIVYEHKYRHLFQFFNGRGIGISLGFFLRKQLLDILHPRNRNKNYYLMNIHENIDISPVVSIDEVRWFAPPVLKSHGVTSNNYEGKNLTYFPADGFFDKTTKDFLADKLRGGRGFDETHTRLTTNISADHCQPPQGVSNLITIRPVNKDNLYYIEQQYSPGSARKRKRRGGKRKTKKKKSKKNKRKKSRRKRKQKGGDDEEPIPFKQLVDGETYDVTFSEEFVNHDNNAPMSVHMTNILFEKMPAHQEGYFKLTFLHQKDGEKEENILYEGNEYGKGKIVYAKRKSGRAGVSPDGGGRRKTKSKKNKIKKKKRKKSRRKR